MSGTLELRVMNEDGSTNTSAAWSFNGIATRGGANLENLSASTEANWVL